MKRLFHFLHIFLILHLLAAFSQASFIAEVNCSHCMQEMMVLADCCSSAGHDVSDRSCALPAETAACPHGGFCQDGDAASALVYQHTVQQACFTDAHPVCIHACIGNYAESPPEQSVAKLTRPPIFILNCSFLI